MKQYKKIKEKIQNFGDIVCGLLYNLKDKNKEISKEVDKGIKLTNTITKEVKEEISDILNPKYYKESMFIDWEKLDESDYKGVPNAYKKFCEYQYEQFRKKEIKKLHKNIESFNFTTKNIVLKENIPNILNDDSFEYKVYIRDIKTINLLQYKIFFDFKLEMKPNIGEINLNGNFVVNGYKYNIMTRGQLPGLIKENIEQVILEKSYDYIQNFLKKDKLPNFPSLKTLLNQLTNRSKIDYNQMKSCGDIFIYLKLLDFLKFDFEFKEWLKEYHNLDLNENLEKLIFKGYHYVVLSIWKAFINEFDSIEIFDMNEDDSYFRGIHFEDIHTNKIPIKSEKISFIKGIIKLGKPLQKARNWSDISIFFKNIESFLKIFENIYEKDVKTYNTDKEGALKAGMINILYEKFHDIHGNKPKIWINYFYQSNEKPKYLIDIFKGYIYTLQFIWFKVLDKTTYSESIVNDLHEILFEFDKIQNNFEEFLLYNLSKYLKKEKEEKPKYIFNLPVFQNESKVEKIQKEREKFIQYCESILVKKEELLKKGENLLNELKSGSFDTKDKRSLNDIKINLWEQEVFSLEDLFSNHGIEKIFSAKIWSSFSLFQTHIHDLVENYPCSTFIKSNWMILQFYVENYLDKTKIKNYFLEFDEDIFNEENFKSEKEAIQRIESKMLWYDVTVLNADYHVFTGVPIFLDVLVGDIQIRKNKKVKEKLKVKIFKHPDANGQGDISIGILIIVTSSIADYSGWLVFYKCATYGYDGFGPNAYKKALEYINNNIDYIDFEEITISHKLFYEYLKKYSIPSLISKLKENESLEQYLSNVKGKLFESFVYKWINFKLHLDEVKWNYSKEKQEIDIIGFNHKIKKVDIYECKIMIHKDLQEIIRRLNLKCKLIKSYYPNYMIRRIIVVFYPIDKEREKIIFQSGIKLIHNFKQIISKDYKTFSKKYNYISLIEGLNLDID